MNPSEQLDQDDHGLADSEATSSPIIIVQRGRSSWGREFLLLLLLIATVGYIFYKEYRGPSVIVRSDSPGPSRLVDAVPVPPLASGPLVLRDTSEDQSDEDQANPTPSTLPERPDRDEAIPTIRPNLMTDLGSVPIESRNEPLASDDAIALAGDDQPSIDEELAVEEPSLEAIRPETAEPEPRRSTHEIVWDFERRDRPSIDPVPSDALIKPRGSGEAGRSIPARQVNRETPPQTIAQRRHFQQCLAQAIRQHGRDAGPHIEGLCRDFRIPLPSEVMLFEQRYGSNLLLQGADIEQTVTALRSIGAPESYLLEQLYEQMSKAIGARRGPRNPMEARVYAARKLLAIPLPMPDANGAPITQ